MKYFILISGLLVSIGLFPAIAQVNSSHSLMQDAENMLAQEGDACINMRGCSRRDTV